MSKHIYLIPTTKENLEKIQENSKRWHKTRLNGKKPQDLAELIYRMMVLREETSYVNKDGTLRKMQCSANRARSVEDVFRVAKYYNPEVTLAEVNDAVVKLHQKHLSHNFCGTVRRYVHHRRNYSSSPKDFREEMKDLNINF